MAIGARSSLEGARRVFADTSYFFALLCPTDVNHSTALELAAELAALNIGIVTAWEVVVECAVLFRTRVGFDLARIFLIDVLPAVSVLYADDVERGQAIDVFLKRGRDRKLSLCDAISFTLVSGRLNWAPCLTFDDDLLALGLNILR